MHSWLVVLITGIWNWKFSRKNHFKVLAVFHRLSFIGLTIGNKCKYKIKHMYMLYTLDTQSQALIKVDLQFMCRQSLMHFIN